MIEKIIILNLPVNKINQYRGEIGMATKKKGTLNKTLNDAEGAITSSSRNTSKRLLPGKEPLKTLYLRLPMSFWEDIQSISDLTGLSMNSVCVDLLRPAIKAKLKQLEDE